MAGCPNIKKNRADCTCTHDCSKKGLCCECVTYHRAKNAIPGCFFTKEGEATYNRSYSNFCADCNPQ